MKKVLGHMVLLGLALALGPACSEDDPYAGDCFIPDVAVNEVINMNLPSYFFLQDMGRHIYLESGNKGIFVIHNYDDQYYALERSCPYQSDLECAYITVDSLNLKLRCGQYADTGFVKCCGSEYLFDGRVVQGPSRCNLKPYRVNMQNNTLYINN